MKRIFGGGSYANVTATIALIVALGGTSYAAVKLPRNSVSSVQVKDRSLLKKDFKLGQIPAGKRGPAGAPGAEGAPGAPGAASVPAVFNRAEGAEALVPGGGTQTIQSMNLPPGAWVVTARFVAENGGGTDGFLACSLTLGGTPVDSLGAGNGTDFGTGDAANALVGAASLPNGGAAAVVCGTNNTVTAGSYRAKSMAAVRVTTVDPG